MKLSSAFFQISLKYLNIPMSEVSEQQLKMKSLFIQAKAIKEINTKKLLLLKIHLHGSLKMLNHHFFSDVENLVVLAAI
jgi:hypothetical protein